jgi:DNA-binding CsgD family transcriptional regulator
MAGAAASTAVSMVESTSEAAFASDEQSYIVGWNRAAERLFGIPAGQALDQPCHETLSGCDIFGNIYCRRDCAAQEMVRRREPVRSFTLDIRTASGEVIRADILVLVLRGPEPNQFTLVHLVLPHPRPRDSNHLLERLWEQAGHVSGDPELPEHGRPRLDETPESSQILTRREVEILRLLSGGARPHGIADTLSVSIHTVRSHIRRILRKLEVHGTTQAVLVALRRHLI